mmetsp:Transcript_1133/g.7362  ORF Transcript_1133/g.7362 Transcript_1133/m.7362 type:complete len:218 (+) Transcript_1133:9106-9759(+)
MSSSMSRSLSRLRFPTTTRVVSPFQGSTYTSWRLFTSTCRLVTNAWATACILPARFFVSLSFFVRFSPCCSSCSLCPSSFLFLLAASSNASSLSLAISHCCNLSCSSTCLTLALVSSSQSASLVLGLTRITTSERVILKALLLIHSTPTVWAIPSPSAVTGRLMASKQADWMRTFCALSPQSDTVSCFSSTSIHFSKCEDSTHDTSLRFSRSNMMQF